MTPDRKALFQGRSRFQLALCTSMFAFAQDLSGLLEAIASPSLVGWRTYKQRMCPANRTSCYGLQAVIVDRSGALLPWRRVQIGSPKTPNVQTKKPQTCRFLQSPGIYDPVVDFYLLDVRG